ncbi:hypothetical protein CEP53_013216, partial [Fusarium sp. AF-6]
MTSPNLNIDHILGSLTLTEKISLLAGESDWQTVGIPSKGIPAVKFSDGPNGARGASFVDSTAAACFPAACCIAATFDSNLTRDIGEALAEETRSKGARCLLGPTVGIHRHPLGGRNFEAFSEDPFLSGKLAAEYINGLQSQGVSATIKHFAANEQETQRLTVNTVVGERTLREIYLRPFEIAVKEAHPWAVMTSYNLLNGEHADSNKYLLQEVLRGDWGWNGLVVSDWGGTNSTADALNAGLDLEMPGPTRWRKQEAVLGAIKAGKLTEETIDQRVKQLLAFLERLRCFHDPRIPDEQAINNPRHQSLIRDVGSRGLVLLKNDANILPLRPAELRDKKIALLGYAKTALAHGGGSASVVSHYKVTPWDALKNALGDEVELSYAKGADTLRYLPPITSGVLDLEGNPGFTYKRYEPNNTIPVEIKNMHPDSFVSVFASVGFRDCDVSLEGLFEVHETGEYYFSCAGLGPSKLFIDNQIVEEQTDNYPDAMGFMFGGAFSNTIKAHLDGGRKYKILAYTCPPTPKEGEVEDMGLLEGHVGLQVGFTPALQLDWDYTTEAVRLAEEADVAVVFTGHEPVWETEGKDQVSFHLPKDGSQDRLISAVAEVNPNVIVVNSTGVPIAMPWLENIKALVQSWYPGQECGNAIADVLTGRTTPEGHLPCTFPRDIRDCPAYGNFPGQSSNKKLTVTYQEGIFVGYRHFDLLAEDKVNFPFGFGLSYTSFDLQGFSVRMMKKNTLEAIVQVTNTGAVAGGIAVQIYVGKENAPKTDPKKQLAGFKKVRLQPQESQMVRILVEDRDFAIYDETEHRWA